MSSTKRTRGAPPSKAKGITKKKQVVAKRPAPRATDTKAKAPRADLARRRVAARRKRAEEIRAAKAREETKARKAEQARARRAAKKKAAEKLAKKRSRAAKKGWETRRAKAVRKRIAGVRLQILTQGDPEGLPFVPDGSTAGGWTILRTMMTRQERRWLQFEEYCDDQPDYDGDAADDWFSPEV